MRGQVRAPLMRKDERLRKGYEQRAAEGKSFWRRKWSYVAPLHRRFASGAFWSIAGMALSRVLTLAALVVLGRILTQDLFGRFCVVRSSLLMIGSLAAVGLGPTTSKYLAGYLKDDSVLAGQLLGFLRLACLCIGVVVAFSTFVLAPWISSTVLETPKLASVFRIAIPLVLFYSLRRIQKSTLAGFEAFKDDALLDTCFSILLVPFVVIGALWGRLEGGFMGMAFAGLVTLVMGEFCIRNQVSRRRIHVSYKSIWANLRVVSRFALPTALCSFLFLPSYWFSEILLIRFSGGFSESAMYAAADQWRYLILSLPLTLNAVALPILSSSEVITEKPQVRRLLRLNIVLSGGVAFLVAMVLAVASPMIMRGYGEDFVSGSTTLSLLGIAAGFSSVSSVAGTALLSAGYAWLRFWLHFLWSLSLLLLAYGMLSIQPTSVALGWANLGAFGLHCLVQCGFAYALVYRTEGKRVWISN